MKLTRRARLVPGWVTVFGRVYHGVTGPCRLRGETPKFKFLILVLHMYCLLVYTYVYLCCVRFSFFHTKTRDWLGETSPKWCIMCRLGRKTTTQSINQVSTASQSPSGGILQFIWQQSKLNNRNRWLIVCDIFKLVFIDFVDVHCSGCQQQHDNSSFIIHRHYTESACTPTHQSTEGKSACIHG